MIEFYKSVKLNGFQEYYKLSLREIWIIDVAKSSKLLIVDSLFESVNYSARFDDRTTQYRSSNGLLAFYFKYR